MESTRSLFREDDVLGDLIAWRMAGLGAVLVTIVGIDGATPRPLGAQMVVAEDGRTAGYLSGGCLEEAVAQEALDVLKDGRRRLVRYGKGSRYFDIKLPCGSGLDLYFDPAVSADLLARAKSLREARRLFVQQFDLVSGEAGIVPSEGPAKTRREGEIFYRAHVPPPRVLLVGGGPALGAVAALVAVTGLGLDVVTPDDVVRDELLRAGLNARGLTVPEAAGLSDLDHWTAAVVTFHDHDWEAPVLAEILKSPCFYIAVMGSRQAHADRLIKLTGMGVASHDLKRLRSPAGLIPGAKSRVTLAVGIVADVFAEAKAAGIVA